MTRMFLILRSSETFRNTWADKVSAKMNMRLKENSFIVCLYFDTYIRLEFQFQTWGLAMNLQLSKEYDYLKELQMI